MFKQLFIVYEHHENMNIPLEIFVLKHATSNIIKCDQLIRILKIVPFLSIFSFLGTFIVHRQAKV